MRYPSCPLKPNKPQKPTVEEYKIEKKIFYKSAKKRTLVEALKSVPENIPVDSLIIQTYRNRYYGYSVLIISQEIKVKNPKFDIAWKKYNEAMEAYPKKLEVYAEKVKNYKIKLKQYRKKQKIAETGEAKATLINLQSAKNRLTKKLYAIESAIEKKRGKKYDKANDLY